MKKGKANKRVVARRHASSGHYMVRGRKGSDTTKHSSKVVQGGMDAVNYAKVISYIVASEEEETRMMVEFSK